MPESISPNRLADLLIDPHEGLDIEIKNWLSLRDSNDDKATFAKAALALANHGGGFILLGLDETGTGAIESTGRPSTLDAYTQDHINGIIQNYADPPFHVAVHHVAAPTGALFPIVSIPGGHRSPIRARRAGPNGNTVENNAIYIRKSGPRSETPQTAQEWDQLLSRCLNNRRDEMFGQIRALISGSVVTAEPSQQPARLEEWIATCLARWHALVATLPTDAPSRCPNGFYWVAYEIVGNLQTIAPTRFPEVLRNSVVRHTGWAPFWYPTRGGIEPYPIDGAVECWIGGDTEAPGMSDPAHSDFWRISPDGFAFLLRGYQEDSMSSDRPTPDGQGIASGTIFDVTLPVWRMGEVLLHAAQLSENLSDGPATINFAAHYDGLSGRRLTSVTGRRAVWDGRIARQNAIDLRTTVDAGSIRPNLPEIIHPLLAPLYSLFDFFDLPASLVSEELAEMRGNRF